MPLSNLKLSPQARNIKGQDSLRVTSFRAYLNPWALLLVLAAMVSGAWFITSQPHPVLTGDAEMYYDLARWLVTRESTPDGQTFAFNMLRAPVYVGFLSAVLLFCQGMAMEAQLQVIRFAQLGLYGLNLWLVFACTLELGKSRAAALLAVVSSVAYLPFLFQTDRLLTETLATTLLFSGLLCWLRGKPLLASLLLFLSLGTNLFSLWGKVVPLVVIAFLAILKVDDDSFCRRTLMLILTLLGLSVVAHLAIRFFGAQEMATTLQAEFLLPNFALNDGWSPLVSAAGNLDYTLFKQQALPEPWATLQTYLPGELGRFAYWISQNPQLFWERYAVNLYRFFARPDNVYGQSWLGMTPQMLKIYHQWLLLAGFLSVPMVWKNRRQLLLYIFPLVWAATYALVHIESRYNLPVMPFVLMTAASGLCYLVTSGVLRWRHLVSVGLPLVVITLWLDGVFYPILLRAFEEISYTLYALSGVAILALWLLGLLIPVFRTIAPKKRISPEFVGLLLVLAVSTPILVVQALTPQVHEWRVALSGEDKAHIRRSIPLDFSFFQPADFKTFLLVDTQPAFAPLKIRINGRSIPSQAIPPPGLPKQNHLLGGLILPEAIRQYRFIPLDAETVASMERSYIADITLTANPDSPPTVLYGDYPTTPAGNLYNIPHPDWQHYSIYKAIYDGDGRPPGQASSQSERSGQVSESLYSYNRSLMGEMDLSPEPGLQTGQYRIFLLRLHPGDVGGEYPAPQFRIAPDGNIFKPFRLAY